MLPEQRMRLSMLMRPERVEGPESEGFDTLSPPVRVRQISDGPGTQMPGPFAHFVCSFADIS
jgi:hypothetical protein